MVSGVFSIPLETYAPQTGAATRGAPCAVALREYIGSDENRLVQQAVDSVLSGALRYHPLVLHGATGTGKSLVALGIADRWRRDHLDDRIMVIGAADFARHFAYAVHTDSLSGFRTKFRSIDLLVLDDLHLLHAKRGAQEELARTIDALSDQRARLIVTSSPSPTTDIDLIASLRSRLAAGLSVPLVAPGVPARRHVLARLAKLHELEIPQTVIEFLAGSLVEPDQDPDERHPRGPAPKNLARASTLPQTVPQLNHAIVQLGHIARVEKRSIDLTVARRYLNELESEKQPTMRSITVKVANYFSMSAEDLRGPSRRRHLVRARGVAMLLAWDLTHESLERVGDYFGNRDHTTVLHACRKTQSLQQADTAISKAVDELRKQLSTP